MIYPLIFCPSIESGGVEKNLFLISNYLSKKMKKIYVLTANTNMSNKFNKNIIFVSPKSNFWSKQNRLIKSLICFFLFIRLNQKFLILSFQSNILAIILAKLFHHKIIIRSNTSPDKYIKNLLTKIIFKFFFNFADEIVVNSYDFKKKLFTLFNLKSKVIYNSAPEIKIKKKKSFNKKNKKLKIINVGRLTHQKNHILLLKTVLNLNDKINWNLDIIGKGYNYETLKKFIFQNNLKKKVRLLGYKKNPLKFMCKADIFVFTSNYEGLPNILIEAQQIGLPIISTDCNTGPREILMGGKLGDLASVGNLKDIKKKIEQFYFDSKILIKKSKLAKNYLYRFDYKKNCNSYYKLTIKYLTNGK